MISKLCLFKGVLLIQAKVKVHPEANINCFRLGHSEVSGCDLIISIVFHLPA